MMCSGFPQVAGTCANGTATAIDFRAVQITESKLAGGRTFDLKVSHRTRRTARCRPGPPQKVRSACIDEH
jgi:hypothetical protein